MAKPSTSAARWIAAALVASTAPAWSAPAALASRHQEERSELRASFRSILDGTWTLEDSSPETVGGRLAALGPAIAPLLFDELCALGGESGPLRAASLNAATRLGRPAFEAQLLAGTEPPAATPSLGARFELVLAVGNSADLERALEAASAAAETGVPLPPALEASVRALLLREPRAHDVVGLFLASAHPEVAGALARALGAVATPASLGTLAAAYENAEALELVILSQIEGMASPELVPVEEGTLELLRPSLWSEDAQLIRTGAIALGKLEDYASVERLAELLDHANPTIRESALWSLQSISGLRLAAPERWRSWFAAELDWLDNEAQSLFQALQHAHPAEVVRALKELSAHRIHRHESAAEIVHLLGHSNPELRRLSCVALADLGSRAAVPALHESLNDRDEGVAEAARAALRAITGAAPAAAEAAPADADPVAAG